jgi:outer membrane receptor protein involved in Fe transport
VLDTGLGAIASFAVPYYIGSDLREGDVSEEMRLSSNWHPSWVNFMIDGYFSDQGNDNIEDAEISAFDSFGQEHLKQRGRTYAGFAQLVLTPIERVEVSVGARYTHVDKFFTYASVYNNNPANAGFQNVNRIGVIPSGNSGITGTNTSPELTINYHPTTDWTVYGSYKRGYKAPGFNANTFLAPTVDPSMLHPFGGEKVDGAEAGIKSFFLDHHLYMTLAAYEYKFSHLQVGFFDQDTGLIVVNNGADAKTRGAELALTYQPEQISGLKVNGSVNYNNAFYSSYPQAPCYGGERHRNASSPLPRPIRT